MASKRSGVSTTDRWRPHRGRGPTGALDLARRHHPHGARDPGGDGPRPPPIACPGENAYYFHNAANLLVAGHGFIDPWQYNVNRHRIVQTADWPPLFVFVLAAASVVGFKSFFAHRIWCCVIGAARGRGVRVDGPPDRRAPGRVDRRVRGGGLPQHLDERRAGLVRDALPAARGRRAARGVSVLEATRRPRRARFWEP